MRSPEEGILPADCFWTWAATLTLPWAFSLLACPADFGLARLHNGVSQFPEINLSLYTHLYLVGSISLEKPTNMGGVGWPRFLQHIRAHTLLAAMWHLHVPHPPLMGAFVSPATTGVWGLLYLLHLSEGWSCAYTGYSHVCCHSLTSLCPLLPYVLPPGQCPLS